jgi:hypothetical protein
MGLLSIAYPQVLSVCRGEGEGEGRNYLPLKIDTGICEEVISQSVKRKEKQ